MKRFLRGFLYFVLSLVAALLLFAAASVLRVDQGDYRDKPFYRQMMSRLDSTDAVRRQSEPSAGFRVGFAKVNLTPAEPLATAGYSNRRGRKYTGVLDSIFVRAVVLDNGSARTAVVSADLLIIPPRVTEVLADRLPAIGFSLDNTYLNAVHTHNSIGHWAEGATQLIYGDYRDSVVQFIAQRIVDAIRIAGDNVAPATLHYGTVPVSKAIRNRLDPLNGVVDSAFHLMEVRRPDARLLLVSYNAHPTCLGSRDIRLSRDYPGELVDRIEKAGYTFAMFLSGAVGSHACNAPERGPACIGWMAAHLAEEAVSHAPGLAPVADTSLVMLRVPLALGEPQVRVARNWRVRPWLFREAFGEYDPYLTGMRIGDVLLLGTPCDFSGELAPGLRRFGASNGMRVLVTSFNGNYIGYITADRHYDRDHYETRLMNWYGPGNGAYLTECLARMTQILAAEER